MTNNFTRCYRHGLTMINVFMKVFLLLLLTGMLICCSQKQTKIIADGDDEIEIPSDTICGCPQCTIYLLPYDNFTKKEAEKLLHKLQKEFDKWLYGHWEFMVLEPVTFPQGSYIKSRNRYKVTPVLNYQLSLIEGNEVIIGLTHKDICTNIHGVEDYGIVGMSRPLKQVCLVSDERLKNKSLIWKPILHEFIHTFYGAKHCPKDDPSCFMKDAKGHGNFEVQDKLCESCLH